MEVSPVSTAEMAVATAVLAVAAADSAVATTISPVATTETIVAMAQSVFPFSAAYGDITLQPMLNAAVAKRRQNIAPFNPVSE